jgi:hypothetical protein
MIRLRGLDDGGDQIAFEQGGAGGLRDGGRSDFQEPFPWAVWRGLALPVFWAILVASPGERVWWLPWGGEARGFTAPFKKPWKCVGQLGVGLQPK